jgi:tricorn protease
MKMSKRLFKCMALLTLALAAAASLQAVDVKNTRLLSQPAVSKSSIAFVYAGDLWIANLDGTGVRRMTSDEGIESNPAFSPDGRLLAFSAQYEGNTDVYVIPVEGGVPVRLTWHPGADIVQGFTPDGASVLFTSGRASYSRSHTQLFAVPAKGGVEEQLKIPNAYQAAYSPDGARLAYNPLAPAFAQWKHYRGGMASIIWLFKFSDNSAMM